MVNALGDHACEHGTALDVHCCNCHSGFIFDADHVCPAPSIASALQRFFDALAARQIDLPEDAARILREHHWELY